jgi:hypothetical protein
MHKALGKKKKTEKKRGEERKEKRGLSPRVSLCLAQRKRPKSK